MGGGTGGAWLAFEDRSELAQVGSLNDELASTQGRLQRDGIAAALLAHGGRVERRGTHLAGDALVADVEADGAADLAGVGHRDDGAVGLFEEQEADLDVAAFSVVEMDAEAVQLVVVDVSGGEGDLRADERNRRGGGELGRALGVDEVGSGQEDEDEAGAGDCPHPHLLAALGPGGAALVGWGGVRIEDGRCAAFVLQQHHQAGKGEHGDEEEEVVAYDGTDEPHLGGARGQYAILAELVQAADEKLKGDEVEDDRRDAEEALQVDLDAAADEEHAEDDGDGDAEQGSGEAEQLGGVEGDGGEDEHGLDAFAKDEEEDEKEEASL